MPNLYSKRNRQYIKKHKDMKILEIKDFNLSYKRGIIEYNGKIFESNLINSIRIIPDGVMEGFFLCKMRKMS